MKKLILFSFALILLHSCEPPATFDKPQPADVKLSTGFSKRIQGSYVSLTDNSILLVTPSSLLRKYDYDTKVHVSQLDTTQQLIGDSLFDLKTSKGICVRIEGDSIVIHVNETDTLFAMDTLNVLKKFKGYYFVNIFKEPANWQVMKLDLSRSTLTLSSINRKEDIDQLKAITETSQDTVPYVFSPTKKQFRQFIRNEGFRDTEKFNRISNRL